MTVPTPICRAGYRVAYALLRCYWFVRRPPVQGVKCVLTQGDRVLLVRHTYGRRDWDLPGGTVRNGEAPAATASREMREELGVEIDCWTPLGQIIGRHEFREDTMHCFQADVAGQAIEMDPCELQTIAWFTPRELPGELGAVAARILRVANMS